VEGHPGEAGQARLQASRHDKVVGLALVQRGHVPCAASAADVECN